ncbi:MAG: caspase family protein, partial [Pseudomonadota bacterium]
MRWLWLLLFAPTLAVAAPDRALLVGVTEYDPSLAAVAPPLAGPGNDVALMADVLQDLGTSPDAITVLTEAAPTRAAILAALDSLAIGATPGEEIAIFLA